MVDATGGLEAADVASKPKLEAGLSSADFLAGEATATCSDRHLLASVRMDRHLEQRPMSRWPSQ